MFCMNKGSKKELPAASVQTFKEILCLFFAPIVFFTKLIDDTILQVIDQLNLISYLKYPFLLFKI